MIYLCRLFLHEFLPYVAVALQVKVQGGFPLDK